jgi:hypothetical protein
MLGATVFSRAIFTLTSTCVAFFILCQSLVGCGGGTSGSGDVTSVKVYGTIVGAEGEAVRIGTVSDLASETSVTLDENGGFELTAQAYEGTITLDITANDTSGTIQINNVLDTTKEITVRLVVDQVSGIVSLASVELGNITENEQDGQITQTVRGVIIDSAGKPTKNVTVSVGGSRFTDTTDTQGRFSLSGHSTDGTLTLNVRHKGLSGEVVIGGIPTDTSCALRVQISLTLEAGQNPGEGTDDGLALVVEVDRVSITTVLKSYFIDNDPPSRALKSIP